MVAGLVVGFLTGFLGVGGGFIIVPALVLTLQYDMPTAVGTSLLIISVNSGVALLARSGHQRFHWSVIVPFTLAAIAGSTAGKRIADRVTVVRAGEYIDTLDMATATIDQVISRMIGRAIHTSARPEHVRIARPLLLTCLTLSAMYMLQAYTFELYF